MPYLHLTSLPLPLETKRALARDLTAATLRALGLPDADRARTTVHFAPTDPADIATGGVLWADGTPPDYFLQVTDHGLTPEKEAALVGALLPALLQGLGLPPGPPSAFLVNIKCNHYDPRDFAIGGVFLPDLWQRRGGGPGRP
jgi:phenylpyruvate tautomerase PptA (4-oxalocrotonate tautomerase family)